MTCIETTLHSFPVIKHLPIFMFQVMTDTFGYIEDHKVTDIRLAICTISCCFALAALIYDYLFPFPVSRSVLTTCVLSYPHDK